MYISNFATAILSLAGISHAISIDGERCKAGPAIPPTIAGVPWEGTPESHHFCEAGYVDGDVLTGIRVWRGDWAVWGMSFRWGNGDFGKIYGDYTDGKKRRDPDQELKWEPTDEVQIKLWDNNGKNGLDAVGWVQVWINGNKLLTQGSDHTGDEISVDAGSKRIIALSGRSQSQAGAELGLVQTLQFHYLESSIVSASMTSITFTEEMDKYNNEQKGIDMSAFLGGIWYENANPIGGLNQSFGMVQTLDYVNTKSVSSSNSHTISNSFGIKIAVEAGIPGLASVKTEGSWDIKYEYQHIDSKETTEIKRESIALSMGSVVGGMPPQSATHCTGTAISGTFESPYTADITATLANDKTFTFKDEGTAKSVRYVDATSTCETMPLDEVPQGVVLREGVDINAKRAVQSKDTNLKRAVRALEFRG